MPRKGDKAVQGHSQMVMTPGAKIRAGVYLRSRRITVWRVFDSVAEATAWQASAKAAQDDPACPPIPLVDLREPAGIRERHSIAEALDLFLREYGETSVGGGTARGQKRRRRTNSRSGDRKAPVTVNNMKRRVRRLKEELGHLDCNTLDRDHIRDALKLLSTRYGLDAQTLSAYEGAMNAAIKTAIGKGWRDRVNPLESPIDIIVDKPLPRRGRIQKDTIVESVYRLLRANGGVWYPVAEIVPLVELRHSDGRPMTFSEARSTITAALWQLLYGEETGIRVSTRVLDPTVAGAHVTHLCVRIWSYDPDLPRPAARPGDVDGDAVTMSGSLRAYCELPWADRMVACTQRLIGTRHGETRACTISDYTPGDRAAGKRGILYLHRRPKPRTSSVRWVMLPWVLDELYQHDLRSRYGDEWRTDPTIGSAPLFVGTGSTYWEHWSEAYYCNGLLHKPDGTTRRPHNQRGDFLTDMWAIADTNIRADASEYAGQGRLYAPTEKPAPVAEHAYVVIGDRHEAARTARGDRVAEAVDTVVEEVLGALGSSSLVQLFVDHDGVLERSWMRRNEVKAIAQSLGMTTSAIVSASGAAVEPGPLPWMKGSGRPMAYERGPIETWLSSLRELAAPPAGMITFREASKKYGLKADALQTFAWNRHWTTERHPITGLQMVEEALVEDYSREHQLPPGSISTKDAGAILGVSADRASVLANKHGWVVGRYGWGKRTALDPSLVREYAEARGKISPPIMKA